MAISSVTPVNNYTGNGSVTKFDFDFLIEESSELQVTKTDSNENVIELILNVDYTIHEIGNNSGSYIIFPIAGSSHSVLASDEVITLALTLEAKQESTFPPDIKLSLPVIEKTFDYVVRLIQILNRKLERAVKVKEKPVLDVDKLVENIDKIELNLNKIINVNDDISNINAVNDNKTNIDAVAGVASSVSNVSNALPKLQCVCDNISEVSTCANNISSINAAYSSAQIAQDKANRAALSASQALSSANIAKNWAVKMDGPVEDGDYSSKYYAQISRDISGVNYNQLNANLGYLRKDVLDDVRLLADVKNYAHSTFDLSKFTVVGSPNITDDGIASGFNSSSIVKANGTFNFGSTFEIYLKINLGTIDSSDKTILSTNNVQGILILAGNGKFRIHLGDGTQWVSGTTTGSGTFSANTDYFLKFTYDGTEYALYVSTDGINYTKDVAYTSATQFLPTGYGLNIGGSRGGIGEFLGSVDLKQVKLVNNTIPVFSGNKTGIDTIKPDDYTVVGTPTITTDGIASGFNSSSIVKANGTFNFGSTFEIYLKINLGTIDSSDKDILSTNNVQGILILTGNGKFRIHLGDGTQWVSETITGSGTFSANTDYFLKFTYDGTEYALYVSTDGINYTKDVAYTSATQFLPNGYGLNIGGSRNGIGDFLGSVDLNAFKIYVDGNLVYQACLKIPYAKSFTGSKVADIQYRNRVIDVYEQGYNERYYTIDEVNKRASLPLGEIYGEIEKNRDAIKTKQTIGDWCNTTPSTTSSATNNKPAVIVENYLNGKNGYRVWSDGLIEQWGYTEVTGPGAISYTVSLLKSFSDTNYFFVRSPYWKASPGNNSNSYFDHGYTAKTQSTITFNMHESTYQYGTDWYAVGY